MTLNLQRDKEHLRLISLFSGIGAFEKALKNINKPYELIAFSDINKFAVRSYCAIHNETEDKNLGDITQINEKLLPTDIDLVTYGFPCQDFSIMGRLQGFEDKDGNKTRSGTFFDALRIIEHCRPKVAIAENVKNLLSKRFKDQFNMVLNSLDNAGYNNYYAVLNAKNYRIPQHRERVFIVSIRKDVDDNSFTMPQSIESEVKLKDFLESNVGDKYYLSEKMMQYLIVTTEKNKARNNGNRYKATDIDGVAKTITTKEGSRIKDNFIEEPIRVRSANKQGYDLAYEGDSINLLQPNSKTRRGRVGKECVKTLDHHCHQAVIERDGDLYRIRRLSPRECFRLMGFSDEDFDKASSVCSDTQLYAQAGNSIVVTVLEEIFKKLYGEVV